MDRARVSDQVVCVSGEPARVQAPITQERSRNKAGYLSNFAWSYAPLVTLEDIVLEVQKVGNARLTLRENTNPSGTAARRVTIGPIPRLRAGKTAVLFDVRMIQLTSDGVDWLPLDYRDAITTETVLFCSMLPRTDGNRCLPNGHVHVQNHDRLMKELREHRDLCVRQFGYGYNIDAIHFVTVYNALLTAVGNWDRDTPAEVVAPLDFSGQDIVDADAMEAFANEKKRVVYMGMFKQIRAAGYKIRHPMSSPKTSDMYVSLVFMCTHTCFHYFSEK